MSRYHLTKYRFWLKILLNAIAIALLVIACYHLNINGFLQSIITWIKDQGTLGIIVFIIVYNLATVLFIPGSFLTLGGGALYGVFFGSIYVFIAATLGATFAFLIGRYLARGYVSQKIRNNITFRITFRAIDAVICREGFKIVFLTRLSPVFPFNLLNYAFGITRVALKDYILGSIGMIPSTIMYVYLGSLVMDINLINSQPNSNPQTQVIQWSLRLIGLLATVFVSIYVARIAKRSLLQITK
ncbi:TVP38/TMEM64 family protein [Pseudanabaena mucicola]|uniref:TVP38/TMEM64 family membrane protein n=1 Tax=Pseudanabaena mucicola FACHB-723 TaxID=2692860 RepID=A0ABR7ZZC8_9CYAN|nr:TVP38/TMEM64 family protein [Pseudanabaena mucicola]MBD2188442.1 TVP38/TMEM64 family protein [Pseudanabaena mucicola FACHB-723]